MKRTLSSFGCLLGLVVAARGGDFRANRLADGAFLVFPLGLEPAQFSDSASVLANGIEVKASSIATWQKREHANGSGFFCRIHCESSGKTVGPWPTYSGKSLNSSVSYNQHVFLSHYRPLPGEPNLTGQMVKLSIKLTVKGRLRAKRSVPYGIDGPARAEYSIGSSGSQPLDLPGPRYRRVPAADTPPEQYDYDLPYNDEYWAAPFPVLLGHEGSFPLNYGLGVYGGADNTSEATATADLFKSGFRVFDLNDNLIWEYTPNADGSPGDRFALVLYNENSTGGGTGMPDVLAPGTPPPSVSIRQSVNGNPEVDYEGIVQQSDDLSQWQDIEPQPAPPFEIVNGPARRFFRARTP